jgi:hypothetical protein
LRKKNVCEQGWQIGYLAAFLAQQLPCLKNQLSQFLADRVQIANFCGRSMYTPHGIWLVYNAFPHPYTPAKPRERELPVHSLWDLSAFSQIHCIGELGVTDKQLMLWCAAEKFLRA